MEYCKKYERMKEETNNYNIINKEDSNNKIAQNTINSLSDINNESSKNIISESSSSELTMKNNVMVHTGEEKEIIPIIYIKTFSEYKYATFIVLSDNAKQYKFKDGINIVVSEEKDIIQFTDRDNIKTVLHLRDLIHNSNGEFIKRIKYIKKISIQELKKKYLIE